MPVVCPFKVTLPPPQPVHKLILEKFDEYGNDVALEEETAGDNISAKFTFRQIRQLSINLANNLLKLGFRKNDIMAIYLENRIHFAPLLLAVSALGGAITGVNPLYTVEELRRQLSDCRPKYIFTKKDLLKNVKEACVGLEIRNIILVDGLVEGTISFLDLYEGDYSQFPRVSINCEEDVVVLPYSSGTTGLPKGVMLTHGNIGLRHFATHTMGIFHDNERHSVIILILPFFHIVGFTALTLALRAGNKGIIMPKFDPINYVALSAKHRATVIHCVPSVLVFLTKREEVEKYDLSHIKSIFFGAAPSGRELIESLTRKFPNLTSIRQGYGMTETAGMVIGTQALKVNQYAIGSCGIPCPKTEIKIVSTDSSSTELGPMQTGEIWIRSPAVMKGYINNEKATRETIDADGWLHSGDLGYYDYFANFYIVDRLKELIKYKAFQVAPAELEDLILKHTSIQEVGVVGLPDPMDPDVGEMTTAYVVLKQGYEPSLKLEANIKQLVADNLAPYKQLRGGVKFCIELPKGPSGKLIRRDIRDGKVKLLESKLYSKL